MSALERIRFASASLLCVDLDYTTPDGGRSTRRIAEARGEIGRNPVEVWKKSRGRGRRGSAARRPNVLSSRELEALLEAAETRFPDTFPLILFLADTGARLGEALALRWVDVDLAAGRARICRSFSSGKRIEATKTGRERSIELSSRLRDTLERSRSPIVVNDALCAAT